MEPGITEEIPAKSVDPFSKPVTFAIFDLYFIPESYKDLQREDLCLVLLLYRHLICRFFLKLSRFPVSLTIFAFTARPRFVSFAMHEDRPKLESCTLNVFFFFFMEDKQAWKRGLITSQPSPPLAHRNVESKGTECFCFREPDFKQKPSGRGKQQ